VAALQASVADPFAVVASTPYFMRQLWRAYTAKFFARDDDIVDGIKTYSSIYSSFHLD